MGSMGGMPQQQPPQMMGQFGGGMGGMIGGQPQMQPAMGQFGGQPQGQFNQPQAPMAQMGGFGGPMGSMGGMPQQQQQQQQQMMGQFGAPMAQMSPALAPAPAPAGPDPFAMFGGIQVLSFVIGCSFMCEHCCDLHTAQARPSSQAITRCTQHDGSCSSACARSCPCIFQPDGRSVRVDVSKF
jgi:hypothetical protein